RMATYFVQVFRVRLREAVDARLIIEPVMAGLAAERRDPELVERQQAVVRAGDEAEGDDEWRAAANEFHTLVVSMSGNRLINLIAQALKDIYTERISGMTFPEEERDTVRRVHAEIADAIASGDADLAETLMR